MKNNYEYKKIRLEEDNKQIYYCIYCHNKITTGNALLQNLGATLVFSKSEDAERYIHDFLFDDDTTRYHVLKYIGTGTVTSCTFVGLTQYSEAINKLLSTSKYTPILGEYCVRIGANYISIRFIDAEFVLSYDSYEEEFMYYSSSEFARDSEDMLAIAHLMESLNDIVYNKE